MTALTALAAVLADIILKAGQVQTALTNLQTFLASF
jgi:hypothetical protein